MHTSRKSSGATFSGAEEYAAERRLLETPTLDLAYYADVPGRVPDCHASDKDKDGIDDIGNGDLPPEWGIDLVVNGGVVRYGPWSDRQRLVAITCRILYFSRPLGSHFSVYSFLQRIKTRYLRPGFDLVTSDNGLR